MTRVLIVDDEPVVLRTIAGLVEAEGYTAVTAQSGDTALKILHEDPAIAAVLLDLVMPDLDGLAVLGAMARTIANAPAIVMTGGGAGETVATALNRGAFDFIEKPVRRERLSVALRNAVRLAALQAVVRTEPPATLPRPGASGPDMPAILRARSLAAKVAKATMPVLIEGEHGVGKATLAAFIHRSGDRSGRPFVTFDCSSARASELESGLFGAGGAIRRASGGTLVLREIGHLPPAIQDRLRDFVETAQLDGPAGRERINVRLIATTCRRLLNLARTGEFNEGLYYRLNVMPIYLPPLRERMGELALLVQEYLVRAAAEAGRPVAGVSPAALDLLRRYTWPGNLRQLEAIIYRAVVLAGQATLTPTEFPQLVSQVAGEAAAADMTRNLSLPSAPVHIDAARMPERTVTGEGSASDRFIDSNGGVASLSDLERDLIAFALAHHGGRMSRAARALGIGRSTLYRKLKEHGLADSAESQAA